MKSLTEIFELQIDDKPNGVVIRLNDDRRCLLRICGIPKSLIYDDKNRLKEFIDITYQNPAIKDIPIKNIIGTKRLNEIRKDFINLSPHQFLGKRLKCKK